MREHSKRIKRLIREWMTEAYERELHRELTKLDESFAEWRRGTISSGELSHRIHEWETGPSRALFKHYNTTRLLRASALAMTCQPLKECTHVT
jgi:hypothetical protein